MSHPFSQIIAQYLRDEDIGTDPLNHEEWPVFVNFEPDRPDNCITVYKTAGGTRDGRMPKIGVVLDHPGIQVRIRSQFFPIGDAKAEEVKAALDRIQRTQVTIEEETYQMQSFTRTSPVVPIGRDEDTGREIFVINGRITFS